MSDTELKKRRMPRIPRLKVWQWGIIGLVVLLLITGGTLLTLNILKKPNLNDVNVITADVGHHYLLPTNETPALATITDTSKLTSAFFKQADNGDKVLIYQNNKVAIIYRPSLDRIIAVGPVAIDTPPSVQNSSQN